MSIELTTYDGRYVRPERAKRRNNTGRKREKDSEKESEQTHSSLPRYLAHTQACSLTLLPRTLVLSLTHSLALSLIFSLTPSDPHYLTYHTVFSLTP